jgi:serine/threonine protein kinase
MLSSHSLTYVPFSQSIPSINFEELKVESAPLTSGSFKSVYKAVWTPAGTQDVQQVAVLVLRQGSSAALEIKIFKKLGRHPHLVKLLAVTRMPPSNNHCMVLELAQRGSLDCVLQEEPVKASHAVLLTVACQVC